MMCLTPITIKNPKVVRPRPEEDAYIRVPCKKCANCIANRVMEWYFRVNEEWKVSSSAAFITLTYNEESLPLSGSGLPTLYPKHVTDFMKRLRKYVNKKYGKTKLKYYLVGEYGSFRGRPHYHIILFNLPKKMLLFKQALTSLWKHGNIRIDNVSQASIKYVVGYVNKDVYQVPKEVEDNRVPSYTRISKGMGLSFLSEKQVNHMKQHLKPYIYMDGGKKVSTPRYYSEKVYSEYEKDVIFEMKREFAETNEPFLDEHHRASYIKNKAKLMKRKNKNRNQF